jgi:hypothetical protein
MVQAIIVRDQAAKDKLQSQLKNAIVLTVYEVIFSVLTLYQISNQVGVGKRS